MRRGSWEMGTGYARTSQAGPADFGLSTTLYGYLCQRVAHTYYPPWLWRNGVKETLEGNPRFAFAKKTAFEPHGKTYSHDLLAADALRWVREQKDKPSFSTSPSPSLISRFRCREDSLAEYLGKFPETPFEKTNHYAPQPTPRAAYAAMVTRMDRDIGRLLDLLRELGLDAKTCVFFSSDNGATFPNIGADTDFFHGNDGLRGYKGELYEGGIRVPLIARWPGRIKPGATSDYVGAFWDVPSTLCELAGTPPPASDGLEFCTQPARRG